MDLQMWMPRSLMIWTLMTSCPAASRMRETLYPRKLLRKCPKCSGLLVLGEEYSTITLDLLPLAWMPYASSVWICNNCSVQ